MRAKLILFVSCLCFAVGTLKAQSSLVLSGGPTYLIETTGGSGGSFRIAYLGEYFGVLSGITSLKTDKSGVSMTTTTIPVLLYSRNTLFGEKKKIKFVWGYGLGGINMKTEGDLMGIDLSGSKWYFGSSLDINIQLDISKPISVYAGAGGDYVGLFTKENTTIGRIDFGIVYKFGGDDKK